MTTIYLIRHTQAEGNWKRTFQGHTDSGVSETGVLQLDCLAKRFEEIHLDAVYASPLDRAIRTAQAVNRDNLPVQIEPALMEINGGLFEGVPFADLPQQFPEEFDHWHNSPELFTAPEGERMLDVYARMRDVIDRIARENQGGTVAIASHGCAIRNYLCYAQGHPLEHLRYIPWCDNTAVNLVEYDHAFQPHLIYFNDSTHLPEEISTLATQNWWRNIPQQPTDKE